MDKKRLIRLIVAEVLDLEPSMVKDDFNFKIDLGADSLDIIEMVLKIEDEFNINIPDAIIDKLESVSDIVLYMGGE